MRKRRGGKGREMKAWVDEEVLLRERKASCTGPW